MATKCLFFAAWMINAKVVVYYLSRVFERLNLARQDDFKTHLPRNSPICFLFSVTRKSIKVAQK